MSLLVKREDAGSVNYKVKNYVIFKTACPPMILANLIFYNVVRYNIVDDKGIGIYCLNDFVLKGNLLYINFCEDTKLMLEFEDGIKGRLDDIKPLEEYGGTWILPFWFKIPPVIE